MISYLTKIAEDLRAAQAMDKVLEQQGGQGQLAETAGEAKIACEKEALDIAKVAFFKGPLAKKLLTGGAYGAGAAIPLVGAGSYLLGKAQDKAEESTADIRNKILQTALGVAGIGGAAYGLKKITDAMSPEGQQAKMSSAEDEEALQDLTTKLATVGALKAMLEDMDTEGMSKQAQELYAKVDVINNAYGAQLLREAMGE